MSLCEKRFPSVSASRASISFSSACRREDRRRRGRRRGHCAVAGAVDVVARVAIATEASSMQSSA
eukprot:6352289-Pyramimonas_sp.AAC.1